MFCSTCGQIIDEGTAFCRNCGAAAPQPQVTAVERSGDLAATEIKPSATPPPPPSFAPTPPPPPPPGFVAPPSAAAGYGQAPQPPQGPPSRNNRTGLIIGVVAAALVVLAGAGTGAFLLARGGDSTETTTTLVGSSSTTTGETTTTSLSASTTAGDGVTTSQTIPGLTTTTFIGTTTTEQSAEDYLTTTDNLVAQLVGDDARIPELATKINDTAPKVPASVRDELQTMMGQLDATFTSLGEVSVPTGFEESNGWLEKAATAMGTRIDATIKGIETMWTANSVGAGTKYFDQGRKARDDYKAAFKKFQDLVPID